MYGFESNNIFKVSNPKSNKNLNNFKQSVLVLSKYSELLEIIFRISLSEQLIVFNNSIRLFFFL